MGKFPARGMAIVVIVAIVCGFIGGVIFRAGADVDTASTTAQTTTTAAPTTTPATTTTLLDCRKLSMSYAGTSIPVAFNNDGSNSCSTSGAFQGDTISANVKIIGTNSTVPEGWPRNAQEAASKWGGTTDRWTSCSNEPATTCWRLNDSPIVNVNIPNVFKVDGWTGTANIGPNSPGYNGPAAELTVRPTTTSPTSSSSSTSSTTSSTTTTTAAPTTTATTVLTPTCSESTGTYRGPRRQSGHGRLRRPNLQPAHL